MTRQIPKVHDLAPLLRFKKPVLSPGNAGSPRA